MVGIAQLYAVVKNDYNNDPTNSGNDYLFELWSGKKLIEITGTQITEVTRKFDKIYQNTDIVSSFFPDTFTQGYLTSSWNYKIGTHHSYWYSVVHDGDAFWYPEYTLSKVGTDSNLWILPDWTIAEEFIDVPFKDYNTVLNSVVGEKDDTILELTHKLHTNQMNNNLLLMGFTTVFLISLSFF